MRVSKSTMLTAMPIGMIHRPTDEPKAIAAADGQPTSTMSRLMPVLVTIAWATSPIEPSISPSTRLMPMKATPMVTAARKARPTLAPRTTAMTKMTMGNRTVAPSVSMAALRPVRNASIL